MRLMKTGITISLLLTTVMLIPLYPPNVTIGQPGKEVVSGKIPKALPPAPGKKSPEPSDVKSSKPSPLHKMGTPLKAMTMPKNQLQLKAVYSVTGKVDPFAPLVQEKGSAYRGVEKVAQRPKRMLTPLEKLDLNQMKLVAIVAMAEMRLAMVEDTAGKGYEVRIGTYMGKNGGRVSAINPEGIEVKEYVKDYKGRSIERLQKIKLRKGNNGE